MTEDATEYVKGARIPVTQAVHDAYRAEFYLIAGEPRGELDLFCDDVLLTTRPLGIAEIAILASGRRDLLGEFLDNLIKSVTH